MTIPNALLQTAVAEVPPFTLREPRDAGERSTVGFEHRGIAIHDAPVPEFGRFAATAELCGMTDAEVLALVRLNATIGDASEAAMNAGAGVIQKHLDITTGDEANAFPTGESDVQIERVFLRRALTEVAKGQAESY